MSLNEAGTMELGTETLPNVEINPELSQDELPFSLLNDINTAARNAGVVVKITTAKTGHRGVTTTGRVSRHAKGQAVDISRINGIGSNGATNGNNGNPKFRDLGNRFALELENLGYTRNSESGNPKAFIWQTNVGGNHYNHIHISNNIITSDNSQKSFIDPNKLLDKILNTRIGGEKLSDILDKIF